MINAKPYYCKEEYTPVFEMCDSAYKVQRMKNLAERGNIQAVAWYGDQFLNGSWDVKRMEIDLACGQLLPESPDPRQDPYTVVPRDQYKAIEYYIYVAQYPQEPCNEVTMARNLLRFFNKRHDTGYRDRDKPSKKSLVIEANYEAIYKKGTPEDLEISPFLPTPYKRPKITSFTTKMFVNIARAEKSKKVLIFGASSLLLNFELFSSSLSRNFTEFLIFFLAFTLIVGIPELLSVFVANYADKNGVPICSCAEIRKAYQLAVSQLPQTFKGNVEDPFKKTPFILRNWLNIYFGFYIAGFVITLILLTLSVNGVVDIIRLATNIGITVITINAFNIYLLLTPILIWYNQKRFGLTDYNCHLQVKSMTPEIPNESI